MRNGFLSDWVLTSRLGAEEEGGLASEKVVAWGAHAYLVVAHG